MPAFLCPFAQDLTISRRLFLQAAAGLVAATPLVRSASAAVAPPSDEPPWFAWLSDTHIAGDRAGWNRGDENIAENLERVVAGILAEPTLPRAAFIDGDLAL